MKKLVFILPYFGKFNNYFPLFLKSCAYNRDTDWIIYTDDKEKYDYPDNVHVKYTTFQDVREKIEARIGFKTALTRPYKLCDFRPIYGDVFSEEIKDYTYWGYCDCDLIFGDISKLVFPILGKKYDKIFFLGHCSLYLNTEENNQIYMKNSNRCKEVFQTEDSCNFDEEFNSSINNIFIKENRRVYFFELEANIYTKSSHFKTLTYDFEEKKYIVKDEKESLFIFEEGTLKKIFRDEKREMKEQEYLYIHLQGRKMRIRITPEIQEKYKIIPNAFEKIEYDSINVFNFSKIKKKAFNLHYFKIRYKNLKTKLKNKIKKAYGF